MLDRSFAWMPALIAVTFVAVTSVLRRRQFWPTLLSMVSITYVGLLAGATLFPVPIDPRALSEFRVIGGSTPNLMPFATIRDAFGLGTVVVVRQLLGNALLFMPLGILAPCICRKCRRWTTVALIGFATSLAIEVTQLCVSLALKYGYRTADIDDVMLNVIGTLFGWLLYLGARRLSRHGWSAVQVVDGKGDTC